ncbi:MAG: hypothetical protein ACAF41_12460 [Leptolyngbya sp. BL-A-14]
MTRRLIIVLVIGQVCLDLAAVVNFWVNSVWQTKVTDLLLSSGLM